MANQKSMEAKQTKEVKEKKKQTNELMRFLFQHSYQICVYYVAGKSIGTVHA